MDVKLLLTFLFWLVNIEILVGLTNYMNHVKNPLFKSSDHWTFKQRLGMWKVAPTTTDQITIETISNVHNALVFHPLTDKRIEAVWASQFIPLYNNTHRYIVRLAYHVKGADSHKLKANIDIAYDDRSHLSGSTTIDIRLSHEKDFSVKCVTFPAYGIVRALMVHFILEEKSSTSIRLTNVNVKLVKEPDVACDMYIESFPHERFVIPNYITPVNEIDGQITIAVQMTLDRLPYLIETAHNWKGKISVCLFLLKEDGQNISKELKKFIYTYYTTEVLYKYVSVHIVTEDEFNNVDTITYPVNFLRNIAIKYASSNYIFLLDADICPVFSQEEAFNWITKAAEKSRGSLKQCEKCAFIAPLFHIKKKTSSLPINKHELLESLSLGSGNGVSAEIEPYAVASHAVVDYNSWYTATDSYNVNYRDDMEPYFIVHKKAPLMNAIYMGYGRDKCAYSRELHAAKYRFIVLSHAFLLNKPHLPDSRSILHRSRGLKLSVYLTIDFHLAELEHDYISPSGSTFVQNYQQEFVEDKDPEYCDSTKEDCKLNGKNKYTKETNKIPSKISADDSPKERTQEVNTENVFSVDNIKCSHLTEGLLAGKLLYNNHNNFLRYAPSDRKEILLETIMRNFGTYTYIESPSNGISGYLRVILSLVHPDVMVSLLPHSETPGVKSDGIFYEYQTTGDLQQGFNTARNNHPGAALVLVNSNQKDDVLKVNINNMWPKILSELTDEDVLVFESRHIDVKNIMSKMCGVKLDWHVFVLTGKQSHFVIMKSIHLMNHPALLGIPPPKVTLQKETPECNEISTDIILLTKNRPMQTLSFLESLSMFIDGVKKVWIIFKADDEVFVNGYKTVKNVILNSSPKFDVEFIQQSKNNLGQEILNTLEDSESRCITFAVDEIIWLKEHNLMTSCCILDRYHDDVASVQLRLGKNLNVFPSQEKLNSLFKERFYQLKFNSEYYVFNPQHWPYDFGYIIHIDGYMGLRQSILNELSGNLEQMTLPGQLETWWSVKYLHMHARQWHVMFEHSLLVNNMYLDDGRVANKQTPIPKSFELCNRFVKDGQKIDVSAFVKEHSGSIKTTHVKKSVRFITYNY